MAAEGSEVAPRVESGRTAVCARLPGGVWRCLNVPKIAERYQSKIAERYQSKIAERYQSKIAERYQSLPND
jgi:hypothetical protein